MAKIQDMQHFKQQNASFNTQTKEFCSTLHTPNIIKHNDVYYS